MNIDMLKKLVVEVCAEAEYDGKEKPSGGKMARTDLVTISKDAQELVNMFGDDAELPDWVEAKLTKAADYLTSVKKYIGGEIVRQQGGLMENTNVDKLARKKRDIKIIHQIMLNKMQANEVQGLLMTLERDYGHVDSSGEEGGLSEASRKDLEDAMSDPFDDFETRDDDLQLPPERKMQKLGSVGRKDELPSLDQLSKSMQRIAALVVNEKVLETLYHRKGELGDSYKSLYSRANNIFNSLLDMRDELERMRK